MILVFKLFVMMCLVWFTPAGCPYATGGIAVLSRQSVNWLMTEVLWQGPCLPYILTVATAVSFRISCGDTIGITFNRKGQCFS